MKMKKFGSGSKSASSRSITRNLLNMDTMIWMNHWTSPGKLECLQKAVGMDNLEGQIETLHLAVTITNSF